MRNFGHNGPEINEKKKISGQLLQFFNMNRLGFVEFWKIISVFAQEKEFVIKLLKILNWVNSSVQAIASLGVARKATKGKKMCLGEKKNFRLVLQCVKQKKKIIMNLFGSTGK